MLGTRNATERDSATQYEPSFRVEKPLSGGSFALEDRCRKRNDAHQACDALGLIGLEPCMGLEAV
jgi:hypothetical protein